jgi:ArsR family transcriptional regulator
MARKQKTVSMESLFRTLADRTRLRLLNLIADREICVCYFVEILKMSQPKISRHLAYLRRAGVVAARRQGRWMHYRLVAPRDPATSALLTETLSHLRKLPEMQADVARLDRNCCAPDVVTRLRPLPSPVIGSQPGQGPSA